MNQSLKVTASRKKSHHHTTNPRIFRTLSEEEEDYQDYPDEASCYGSECPVTRQVVVNPNSKVIIYFSWLSDSFLLLPVIRNQLSLFSLNYQAEMYNLLPQEYEVGVTDLVWDDKDMVLFIEYEELPPRLIEQFRKLSASTRTRVRGARTIEDIALIQFSLLSGESKRYGTGSLKIGGYGVSRAVQATISYLPPNF